MEGGGGIILTNCALYMLFFTDQSLGLIESAINNMFSEDGFVVNKVKKLSL